jgi:hypothetical protein
MELKVETYTTHAGEQHHWRVTVGDRVVAVSPHGYRTEGAAMDAFDAFTNAIIRQTTGFRVI